MFGIEKIMTTPYHAQYNGQVEIFHQTLMRMVGKVWHDHESSTSTQSSAGLQRDVISHDGVLVPLPYVWVAPPTPH